MVEFSFTHGQLWMIGILALVILGLTAFVAIVWYDRKLTKKIRKKFTAKPIRYANFLKGGAPRFVMECHTTTIKQARRVMQLLYRTLKKNGILTLGDYYRCFGEKCELSDEAWGWTDIPDNSMYALMIDGKYHVMMPELDPLEPKPIDPELELKKRVPEVTLESLQRDIEMIKVSIGYDWNGDLRDIENLQQRVRLNSNNIERNSEHCECLFNISRDNLGEFKEQMDTIVQEIHDEMDKLQRRLDGLSDRLEKESCDLYNEIENNSESSMSAYGRLDERMNQMMNAIVEAAKEDDQETRDVAKELDDLKRSIGDITEEVYSYRDLTDEMDKRFKSHHNMHVNTQNWFSRLEKEIEEIRRHVNEGTGKIKKLKKKLRRMEVGQTNGNQ